MVIPAGSLSSRFATSSGLYTGRIRAIGITDGGRISSREALFIEEGNTIYFIITGYLESQEKFSFENEKK